MLLYLLIIGVSLLLSIGASALVKAQFARGQRVAVSSGITGAEVAKRILAAQGISNVGVVESPGFLSDHYNPLKRELGLSPDVYHGRSAAAAGVAAHEVGHALQHAQGSISMWLRSALAPAAGFGSSMGPLIVMVGVLMGGYAQAMAEVPGTAYYITIAGVVLFGAATLMTLITVPNEFDASARARVLLADLGIVRGDEETGAVRGVLTAAGLTYVAAAVTSAMWLLYMAWPLLAGNNSDD